MQPTSNQIDRRYIVQRMLGQGGMGAVYKATDRLNGQDVALKKVVISPGQLTDTPGSDNDFRIALSDEFRTLASLRHPNIISVLDYGFEDKQPYFTMELIDSPKTILEAGKNAPLDAQIGILIELLHALTYLHRRGVLHRDLKPGNVLVTSDGTVKVLDFGLSMMTTYSHSRVQESTAGTLAYMAPELLSDDTASVASDLYAVGVIACELLTGHHPFTLKNVGQLIVGILSAPPDLSGLDGDLFDVVARLLEKQPQDRYENAVDVIHDLCSATGQPAPIESQAIRESFLQAAKFVGRQAELRQLRAVLDAIVKADTGQNDANSSVTKAWLIGGESGIGKTRLLDEFRTRALINGMLVLRGQATTEGNVPYQMWYEPLRRLVLSVDLPDDAAPMLKNIITDIEVLLDRPVGEPPVLDAKAGRNLFLYVVRDMFRAVKQPTTVILEDLQWASDEDIELLQSLVPLTADAPLLLLASYRDDERPELPERLAEMTVLKLKRLDVTGIAELCQSILGSTTADSRLVEWLYKETEGNVFFLVEVVRALAEMAGEIDLINVQHLPSSILPDGIQNVVRRRLNRVPETGHPLLQLAALAGRVLDLDLLREFTADLDTWLEQCSSSGVLDVEQDSWRFAHDKLRESILLSINPQQLPELHLKLAQKLEQLFANDFAYIPAIARHYQQAGKHEKAILYWVRTAELARKSYSNENAIAAATAVLASIEYLLQANFDTSEWHETHIQMIELLGDLAEVTGRSEDSRVWFENGIAVLKATDVIPQARFYRKWANTWVTQRQPEKSLPLFQKAQVGLHSNSNTAQAWWAEWLDLHLDLIWANYWLGQPDEMQELLQKIQLRLDEFGNPLQRSRFYRSLTLIDMRRQTLGIPLSEDTIAHAREAVNASRTSGNLFEISIALFTLGLAHVMRREWHEAKPELQQSLKLSEQIGAAENRLLALTYLTIVYRHLLQDELVVQYATLSLEAAIAAKITIYIAVAKANLGWLAWRKSNVVQTQELCEAAIDLWRQFALPFPIQWLAYWPLIHIKAGEEEFPLEYLKALLHPWQLIPPEPLADLIRSAVATWEAGETELAQTQLKEILDLAHQMNYL